MKILVGSYQCESNTFSPNVAKKENFYRLYGEDAKNELVATRVFEAEGFEVAPLGYAVALPSGSVCREDYLEMLSEFLAEAERHKDADGVYLYFHGAMYVDGIGSGEEYFVKRLREVIGNEIPISVASDFHSNVSDGLRENIQALSGFRTAPHTDYDETEIRAAKALVRILKEQLKPTLHLFRVKVLFADAAQTAGEPYRTLLSMLREAEQDERVISASIYNGQPWVDAEFVGACVAVSLANDNGEVYARFKAIADYYEAHKTDMKFDMPALSPDATVRAVKDLPKPVFISDSGDNSTAGADGESTFLLGKMLGGDTGHGLVASLFAPEIYETLCAMADGSHASVTLAAKDEYSEPLSLSGTVVGRGVILGFVGERVGEGVLYRSEQGVDIIFSNARTSFTTEAHFSEMGVEPADYDWVALKMGYLWPGVDGLAKSRIFCLTPGSSTNDFSTLNFKNLRGEYYYIKPDNSFNSEEKETKNELKNTKGDMNMEIGKKIWVFSDGDLPPQGKREPLGHEALMVVNNNEQEAVIKMTLLFEDKDPKEGLTLRVPAKRVNCFRMDFPVGEEKFEIPAGQFAVILESDVPIVAVYGRLDRRKDMAYYPVQGYSL